MRERDGERERRERESVREEPCKDNSHFVIGVRTTIIHSTMRGVTI